MEKNWNSNWDGFKPGRCEPYICEMSATLFRRTTLHMKEMTLS